MKLSFRWFGDKDPVSLQYIRQISGVGNIVSQLYGNPAGALLNPDVLKQAVAAVQKEGMIFSVYESLAVHSSILLGLPERDHYIDTYNKNLKLLSEGGVKVVCYNFRPVFRWARTEIYKVLDDGSSVSEFSKKDAHTIDPFVHSVEESAWYQEQSKYIYSNQLTTDLELDGYYTEESNRILSDLKGQFLELGKEGLWSNLKYFLMRIIPKAEEYGLRMALHPDDPPWDIFGVPRLFTDEESLDRLLSLYDSPGNGILFCSGTLGSNIKSDVVQLAGKYARMNRIPFAHIRNVLRTEDSMEECAHYSPCGSIDMVRLLEALYDSGFSGYVRPDHGRMIWDEEGKPGNGIYDRALGAQYILGIWETLGKLKK